MYEIYSENVQLAKKLSRIMEFKVLLQDFEYLEPLYYNLPSEEVRKIEVYIHSLKARVQIGRMMKVNIDLANVKCMDTASPKPELETIDSQKRVKSQMNFDDNEELPSKKLYTDNEVGNFSKNILNSVTPSFNILSQASSFNTIFLSPKKKETIELPISDNKVEKAENKAMMKRKSFRNSGKYEPLTTLEQIVGEDEGKNEQEKNEEGKNSNEALKNSEEVDNEKNKTRKPLQRELTLGKFNTSLQNKQTKVYEIISGEECKNEDINSLDEARKKSVAAEKEENKPRKPLQRELTLGKLNAGVANKRGYVITNDSSQVQTPNESFNEPY